MWQNYSYLKDVAYYPYIPDLEKAGLNYKKTIMTTGFAL